ncbi:MAG TPA: hypothetical protein VFA15_08920, partial [Nitrososphaera sp.]|nr:hypothetical protein [Nitrososphaera sp.]
MKQRLTQYLSGIVRREETYTQMLTHKTLLVAMTLTLSLMVGGCENSGGQTSVDASSTSTPPPAAKSSPTIESPPAHSADSTEKASEQGESPNPEDAKDPDFFNANRVVREFAKAYWDERFIKCGTNRQGDERWFSVQETNTASRYLEIINLRTATSPPTRLSSADRLNRVWHAASTLQSTAYRWCSEGPCGEYSGGVVGV